MLTTVLVNVGARPASAATTRYQPPEPVVLSGLAYARSPIVSGSYLYFSVEAGLSDATPDAVAQVSFDGTVHNMLGPIDGAYGVVVRQGVLYVAAEFEDAIHRYDLSTDPPTLLGSTDTGSFTHPRRLAVTNGRIWFDSDCLGNWTAKIISMAPDGTDVQKELPFTGEVDPSWRYCAQLQASPLTKHLFVSLENMTPSELSVYDLTTTPYTRLTGEESGQFPSSYWNGAVEPLPGGTTVAMSAFPSPAEGLDIRNISDLTVAHNYDAHWMGLLAIDHTTANGGLFAVRYLPNDSAWEGVGIIPEGATGPSVEYTIPNIVDDGVVFTPDGSSLLAVASNGWETRLYIIDPLAIPTTLTFSATPASVNVGDTVDLDGTFTPSDGQLDGHQIEITRTDASGTIDLGPAMTDTSGVFHLTDQPPVGEFTYTATFQATGHYEGATAEDSVRVAPLTSHVSIHVSDERITYGQSVRVTAHLGDGTTNRDISIYTKKYGGDPKLLKTGTVDADGDLRASFTPKELTTFIVRFAGDDTHKGSSDSTKTYVKVILKAKMIGFDHKSGKYKVYREGTYPTCVVGVAPNHRGYSVRFALDVYYKGKWRTVGHASVKLNRRSLGGVRVNLKPGYNARIRATLPSHTDHIGDSSPWLYFRVA